MASNAVVIFFCLMTFTTTMAETQGANPIRRVVTMLQNMQKKITKEGEKEQDLFDKYMCYCQTSGGDLSKSIADANTKVPQLASDIKADEAALAQTKEDVKQAQTDRAAAKEAVATATAIREKEAAAYAKTSSELTANINACAAATTAIEKGMAGAFLQTSTASVLKRLVKDSQKIVDADRDQLLSFLSGSEGYAPSSGQIVGILKTMHDEFSATLAEETDKENGAIKAYDALMASKTKEINALQKAIETKMTRSGELAVKIQQMKGDLGDTEAALLEDQAFLKDLDKNCATKKKEWAVIVETRNTELVALADTIKILNDDDALDLFKKTLPSSASFMQVKVSTGSTRSRALAALRKVQSTNEGDKPHLDFIAMAIQGKKIGFEKVITMIDEMIATLKTEQQDDDHKKEYCEKQFDLADDKKKSLEHSISDLETAIEDAKEGIAATQSDIAALQASIKALDKAVAQATEQRKEEHEDFTDLMASDAAAKELLGYAANRLNKFYNPALYKPPPKRELSAEDRATLAAGGTLPPTPTPGGIAGTGITVGLVQDGAAPPPPPEAPGAYVKKEQESTGVITMINLLVKDLDKEMAEAQVTEKDSQADYETFMKDSATKRADDAHSLADKERTLADLQAGLQSQTDEKASTEKELTATNQYIASVHADCDWLLKYFDVRAEARASEVDALSNAKAVLNGADYSLVQMKSKKFLRSA